MRFNSIEIHNYRQYKDLQLDFQKRGQYDLHIIIGENTLGKTNLLNAITWCLYGIEPHLGSSSKILPKLNLMVKEETLEYGNERSTILVKIIAEDNGQMITYQRKLPVNAANDFEYMEEFTVTISHDTGDTKIFENDDAEIYVSKYMPEKIRQYFYFDGEQLNNYFVSEQISRIEESIHAISQVDVVTRISGRLSKIIAKKQKEAGLKNSDISELIEAKERAQAQLDDSSETITELCEQIDKSEKVIEENTAHLSGQDNLPELEERYKISEERLNKYEVEKKDINDKLFLFIKKFKVILSFYPSAKYTLGIIAEKQASHALPSTIDKPLLEEMLLVHKCLVCERSLATEDEKTINDLLEKIQVSSETSHLLVNIKSELERVVKKAKEYPGYKNEILLKKKQNKSNIEAIEGELQKIDEAIRKFTDKQQVIQWHGERKSHKELLGQNTQKLGVAKQRLIEAQNKFNYADGALSRAIAKSGECERINQLVKFSEKAKSIIEQIEIEMMSEVKDKMQLMTMHYFEKLNWKKNAYDRIELDEKYQLDLFHKSGYSCVGSCSAAERSLLALSFTLALHEVSGFNALLFIDTPVARVSGQNRINFADVLNDVSKNKQIIMTFANDEYSEEIRNVFEGHASTLVRLSTDNEIVTMVN